MKVPQNTRRELEIIKMMIDDKEAVPIIITLLSPKCFYNQIHAENFTTMVNDFKEVGVVDITKLKMASQYLDSDHFNTVNFAEQFCNELIELRKQRDLLFVCSELQEKPVSSKEMANKMFTAIADTEEDVGYDPDIKAIASRVYDKWCEQRDGELLGVDTGVRQFNEMIEGYCQGHYWVLGAYTNYGKTSFACYLIAQLIKTSPDTRMAFFSTEMTQHQVYERIVTQYGERGIKVVRTKPELYTQQIDVIYGSKLRIYDNKFSVGEIQTELMFLKSKGELPRVVFVDFLQNLQGSGSEYERMSLITRDLQILTMKMGITMIVLSQISNEGARMVSEVMPFKGSGGIAASADLGIQLVRNKTAELDQNLELVDLEVRVIKNRHGRVGRFMCELNTNNGVILIN